MLSTIGGFLEFSLSGLIRGVTGGAVRAKNTGKAATHDYIKGTPLKGVDAVRKQFFERKKAVPQPESPSVLQLRMELGADRIVKKR